MRSLIGSLSWILASRWLGLKPVHCTTSTFCSNSVWRVLNQIHEGGLWLADEAYTCPWLRSLIGLLSWILTPHWLGLKPAHCTSFTRENWFRQGWTTTSRMILASSFLFAVAFACLLPRLPGTEVSLQTPHKQENKSSPGHQPCSFLATWCNKEIENCGHLKSGI